MKIRLGYVLITVLFLFSAAVSYADNNNPLLPAPAPVLGAGWNSDEVDGIGTPSLDSPYVYALAAPAIFRITDDYIPGDVYTVTDFGNPILVTAVLAGQPALGGDPNGWLNPGWYKGWVDLGVGAHSLVVTGNGAGGIPAGFFDRIDTATTVPEPSAIMLLGTLMGGLFILRRRFI